MLLQSYLTKAVKQHVEVGEHSSSGDLHNVVESLTGVVPQAAVRVVEAREHRLDQLLQVQPWILQDVQAEVTDEKKILIK